MVKRKTKNNLRILGVIVLLISLAWFGGLFSFVFEPTLADARVVVNDVKDFNAGFIDISVKSINSWNSRDYNVFKGECSDNRMWNSITFESEGQTYSMAPSQWFKDAFVIIEDDNEPWMVVPPVRPSYAVWFAGNMIPQELAKMTPEQASEKDIDCYLDNGFPIYPRAQELENNIWVLVESIPLGGRVGSDNEEVMKFYYGSYPSQTSGSLSKEQGISSFWRVQPDLTIEIEDDNSLFEKEKHIMPIKVTNNIGKFNGRLGIRYSFKTPFGESKDVELSDLTFEEGEQVFEINIPASAPGELLVEVQPAVLFAPGTPYERNISIPVTVNHTYLISPQPIYIDIPSGGCDSLEDYALSQDENYCVRNDLLDAACTQIGCPFITVDGKQVFYECTSAGLCAQTISQAGCEMDEDCRSGEVCVSNNEGTNFCVLEQIKDEPLIQVLPEPFELRQSCNELSFGDDLCVEGYECVDETINDELVANCVKKKTNIKDVPLVIIIIGIIALILFANFFGKKLKNKKGRKRGR